jgi:periplasmic divalent cation tolerance protein
MELMQETAGDRLVCVQTTLDDGDAAAAFARRLVEAGMAACVQVSEIRSTYRWEGKVETAAEQLLTIKTAANRLEALAAFVRDAHPYDEPEFLVLPVDAASEGYAAWIRQSVR